MSVQLLSATAPSTNHIRVRIRFMLRRLDAAATYLKAGTALRTLEHDDRAAERLDVVAHEGQSQTRAARDAAVVRRAPAEEALEHLLVLVGRYAETGVVDVNLETLTFHIDANRDRVTG